MVFAQSAVLADLFAGGTGGISMDKNTVLFTTTLMTNRP